MLLPSETGMLTSATCSDCKLFCTEQLRERQARAGLSMKAGVMTAIEAIMIEAHHPQPLKEQLTHVVTYWATLQGILQGATFCYSDKLNALRVRALR